MDKMEAKMDNMETDLRANTSCLRQMDAELVDVKHQVGSLVEEVQGTVGARLTALEVRFEENEFHLRTLDDQMVRYEKGVEQGLQELHTGLSDLGQGLRAEVGKVQIGLEGVRGQAADLTDKIRGLAKEMPTQVRSEMEKEARHLLGAMQTQVRIEVQKETRTLEAKLDGMVQQQITEKIQKKGKELEENIGKESEKRYKKIEEGMQKRIKEEAENVAERRAMEMVAVTSAIQQQLGSLQAVVEKLKNSPGSSDGVEKEALADLDERLKSCSDTVAALQEQVAHVTEGAQYGAVALAKSESLHQYMGKLEHSMHCLWSQFWALVDLSPFQSEGQPSHVPLVKRLLGVEQAVQHLWRREPHSREGTTSAPGAGGEEMRRYIDEVEAIKAQVAEVVSQVQNLANEVKAWTETGRGMASQRGQNSGGHVGGEIGQAHLRQAERRIEALEVGLQEAKAKLDEEWKELRQEQEKFELQLRELHAWREGSDGEYKELRQEQRKFQSQLLGLHEGASHASQAPELAQRLQQLDEEVKSVVRESEKLAQGHAEAVRRIKEEVLDAVRPDLQSANSAELWREVHRLGEEVGRLHSEGGLSAALSLSGSVSAAREQEQALRGLVQDLEEGNISSVAMRALSRGVAGVLAEEQGSQTPLQVAQQVRRLQDQAGGLEQEVATLVMVSSEHKHRLDRVERTVEQVSSRVDDHRYGEREGEPTGSEIEEEGDSRHEEYVQPRDPSLYSGRWAGRGNQFGYGRGRGASGGVHGREHRRGLELGGRGNGWGHTQEGGRGGGRMGAGSYHGGRGEHRDSGPPGTLIVQRYPKFVALQNTLTSLREYVNWVMDNEPELERALQEGHHMQLIKGWLRQATQKDKDLQQLIDNECTRVMDGGERPCEVLRRVAVHRKMEHRFSSEFEQLQRDVWQIRHMEHLPEATSRVRSLLQTYQVVGGAGRADFLASAVFQEWAKFKAATMAVFSKTEILSHLHRPLMEGDDRARAGMDVAVNIREFLDCLDELHSGLNIRMSDAAPVQQSGHGAAGRLEPGTAAVQLVPGAARTPAASLHVLSSTHMGGDAPWEPVPHVATMEYQLATRGVAVDCEDSWTFHTAADGEECENAEFAAMAGGGSGGFGGTQNRNSRMEALARDLCHYAAAVGVALAPQEVHKALMGPEGRGAGADGVQRCVLCKSCRTTGTQGVALGHDRWIDCPLYLLGKVIYRKNAGLEGHFVSPALQSAVRDFSRQISSRGSDGQHIMETAQSFVGKPQASQLQGRLAPSTPSRGQLSTSLFNTPVATRNAAHGEGGAKNGGHGA